jgi:hypothetical protein
MPFGHWVETFRELDCETPGRLLRASTVRQEGHNVAIGGATGLRATSRLERYPPSFDYFEHIGDNQTPPVSVAFPRGVFHDLGIRFDESLTTMEDWDYIMRVAAVVGVASNAEITSIYRFWYQDESSRTMHPEEEWQRNRIRIREKMDDALILFPAGTTARIRQLLNVDQNRDRSHFDANDNWQASKLVSTDILRGSYPLEGDPGKQYAWLSNLASLTLVPKFPPKRLIIDYNYPLDTLSKSDPRFSKMEIELFVNGRKVTARTIDKDGSDQIAADVSQLAISAGDDVEIHIVADKALMPSAHGLNDKRLLSMIVSKIYFD